jgi:hypothetical protein
VWPSELKANDIPIKPLVVRMAVAVEVFQTLTMRSSLALTNVLPSAAKAKDLTIEVCARIDRDCQREADRCLSSGTVDAARRQTLTTPRTSKVLMNFMVFLVAITCSWTQFVTPPHNISFINRHPVRIGCIAGTKNGNQNAFQARHLSGAVFPALQLANHDVAHVVLA